MGVSFGKLANPEKEWIYIFWCYTFHAKWYDSHYETNSLHRQSVYNKTLSSPTSFGGQNQLHLVPVSLVLRNTETMILNFNILLTVHLNIFVY